MRILLKYHAVCDIGNLRENNEDIAFVAGRLLRDGMCEGKIEQSEAFVAFAVADGMGGYNGGEVASEIVCRSFGDFMKRLSPIIGISELKKWAIGTNRLIFDTGKLRKEFYGMGSTFIALIFTYDKVFLINVGDSRCYRLRNKVLKQISIDHSERERTGNPEIPSNLIYNFMGNSPEEFISDITELKPIPGDKYILCSDGLSDLVEDDTIETNCDDVSRLIRFAKDAGGQDNITVITIEYELV